MERSRKSASDRLLAALGALGPAGPDRPLAVAFSGGLDSTVLLHALCRVREPSQVLALHVHHGLQPAAENWSAHCVAAASALGARCEVLRIGQRPPAGTSIEGWARGERYRLLLAAARAANAPALLTAHHADDQLETILLALARGCGLDGLTGIASEDRRENVRLLRPLLAVTRAELQAWATAQGLRWVEDPSNADLGRARNAVRHRLMPTVREVLPALATKLPDTLALLGQARRVIEERATEDANAARVAPASGLELDRRVLARLPHERAAGALRAWLRQLDLRTPTRAKLLEIHAQLVEGAAAYGEVRHADRLLVRYRDRLLALPVAAVTALSDQGRRRAEGEHRLAWAGEPAVVLADGGGRLRFEPDPLGGVSAAWLRGQPLHVRPGRAGERLRPVRGGPARTMKNLHQEGGVPGWMRPLFPTVWAGDRLLFAAPYGMDHSPGWPRGADGVRLSWAPQGGDDPRAWFCATHIV
jgi:tRNA(Ile)-lysidine synthase